MLLLLLLAVPVSVWADPPQRIGGGIPDCLIWHDTDNGIQVDGKGCRQYLQKPGCYKNMQEAMRTMELLHQLTVSELTMNKDLKENVLKPNGRKWDSVMKECVK